MRDSRSRDPRTADTVVERVGPGVKGRVCETVGEHLSQLRAHRQHEAGRVRGIAIRHADCDQGISHQARLGRQGDSGVGSRAANDNVAHWKEIRVPGGGAEGQSVAFGVADGERNGGNRGVGIRDHVRDRADGWRPHFQKKIGSRGIDIIAHGDGDSA